MICQDIRGKMTRLVSCRLFHWKNDSRWCTATAIQNQKHILLFRSRYVRFIRNKQLEQDNTENKYSLSTPRSTQPHKENTQNIVTIVITDLLIQLQIIVLFNMRSKTDSANHNRHKENTKYSDNIYTTIKYIGLVYRIQFN